MTRDKFLHIGDLIVSQRFAWMGVATRHAEPIEYADNRFQIFWNDLNETRKEFVRTADELEGFTVVR
jgi:hypothetical protein